MKKLSLLLSGLLLLGACNKKTVDPPGVCGVVMLPLDSTGYFAFGSTYGMCPGNCATFFEIKNKNLYPDSLDHYAGTLYFKNSPLASDRYTWAKNLLYNMPEDLRNQPNTTYGCPDCHDQGQYYIEYKASATAPVQYWHIDTDTGALPSSIKWFALNMGQMIDSLK